MPINNKAYDLYDLHEEALSSKILEEIKIQFRCLTFTRQEFVVPLYSLLVAVQEGSMGMVTPCLAAFVNTCVLLSFYLCPRIYFLNVTWYYLHNSVEGFFLQKYKLKRR